MTPIRRQSTFALSRFADVAAIGLGLWLAYALRGLHDPGRYVLAGALAQLLYLLLRGGAADGRDAVSGMPGADVSAALGAWGATLSVLLASAWMTKTSADYSRIAVGLWALFAGFGLTGWRLALRAVWGRAGARRDPPAAAIAGAGPEAQRFARFVESAAAPPFRIAGFFAENAAARSDGTKSAHPLLGDFDALVVGAGRRDFSTVFVALHAAAEARARRLVNALSDTPATVYVVPSQSTEELVHARWVSLRGLPVISILESPLGGTNGWVKRIEDLLLSIAALVVAGLPMLLVAAAVKLSSPGPVLFRQRRHGIDGQEIGMFKFRTMTVLEDGDAVRHVVDGDPRLTPIGAFLRRTSLDELPQFFNVLRGEMSVVGPRPHAVAINERYRRLIPSYMLRHRVKPGITGWAQIHGLRGSESFEHMHERIRYDLWYIGRWSLWLDLKIVIRTVGLLAGDANAR